MKNDTIFIDKARTHNLKDISLEIPKNKIVVFTGVSGSGKSSLVFDTIYTEAQRQLMETFSSFARARMPKLSRPDIDEIHNISTAIVIDQKKMGRTSRSSVGTATELATYLRLLYSRCGDPYIGPSNFFSSGNPMGMCTRCKGLGRVLKVDTERLINWDNSISGGAINHPDYRIGAWHWRELCVNPLFDPDKKLRDFSEDELECFLFAKGIPIQKKHGAGTYRKNFTGIVRCLKNIYLKKNISELNRARREAYENFFHHVDCKSCSGSGLNELARSVKVEGMTIDSLMQMELSDLYDFLGGVTGEMAEPMVLKMRGILSHLIEIGVGYLSLNRPIGTLSGGESQRVKMARQLDCSLVDIMYVMDEPSIGLHPRDTSRLIGLLKKLRDRGNSVFVVEHDRDIICSADHAVDIGPYAGTGGGNLIYSGDLAGLKISGGLTGEYLSRKAEAADSRKKGEAFIEIVNASVNNLKNISTGIPRGVLTCITGVAGSGKSSLIHHHFMNKEKGVVLIDQSPPGKSSRSNPATYIGVFDLIRREFAAASNVSASLFSFNAKGACPKCRGRGSVAIEMSFLDEIVITCDECRGMRYRDEVLEYRYCDKNIFEVLDMTVDEALEFFDKQEIRNRLQMLVDVGLGYLKLGQSFSTLSGGEGQRLKLASELHRKGNIYVMDEPSTGLHMADIEGFLKIVKKLTAGGNTVIIIEHNLDIIRQSDWIIDLGPEGGDNGGEVIFEGIPEDLVRCEGSHTGRYLKAVL